MKHKRILHIAPAYQSNGGGIYEVVENLTITQAQNPFFSIDILCTESCKEVCKNRTIYNYLPSRLIKFRSFFKSLSFLKESLKFYDVIHIHGAWSFQFFLIAPFLKKVKNIVIYQPHGLLSPVAMKKNFLVKRMAWYIYQNFLLLYCKTLICCSKKEYSEVVSLKINNLVVEIISNGIDEQFFEPKKNIKKIDRFLFLSQLIPIKNLEELFYAIQILKNDCDLKVCIDLYGYGPEDYIISLKKLVKKLNISENINFMGRVERSNRIEVYDNYKYFILPSLSENFSISILEALSRNCIVISSDQTPWVDFDHPNLIITKTDKESIAHTINIILKTTGEYNYDSYFDLEDYSWESISKKLLTIYFREYA